MSALLAAAAAGMIVAPGQVCEAGAAAEFFAPVARYGHAVLGDTPEWAGLRLTAPVRAEVELPADRVFEDLAPRLVDLDGDCRPELVVVESGVAEGAQLAVYGIERDRLVKIAATPPIGRRFRWLAPVGAADLDGDGALELAFVRTPHIGGVLEVWGVAPGGLTRLAALEGVSNHRIGEAFISGDLRDCGDGPEMVLADARWTATLVARLGPDGIEARRAAEDARPETLARTMECR